jgi:GTPase SAR1 family protein
VENCLTTYDPHAFVLIYSITDRGSFQFAEEVLKYLWRESCTKEKAVILVGNKVDLARSRIIKCEGNVSLNNICFPFSNGSFRPKGNPTSTNEIWPSSIIVTDLSLSLSCSRAIALAIYHIILIDLPKTFS